MESSTILTSWICKSFIIWLALLFLPACVSGYQGDLYQIGSYRNYYRVVYNYTKNDKHFIDFNQGYYINSTLKTPQFRTAYINAMADDYYLSPSAREELVNKEKKEAGQGLDFLVAINGYNDDWEKLDPKTNIWRISCAVNEGQYYPVSKVNKLTKDPKLFHFYPYLNHWTEVYLLHCDFPQEVASWSEINKVRLLFASVMGKTLLDWELTAR